MRSKHRKGNSLISHQGSLTETKRSAISRLSEVNSIKPQAVEDSDQLKEACPAGGVPHSYKCSVLRKSSSEACKPYDLTSPPWRCGRKSHTFQRTYEIAKN